MGDFNQKEHLRQKIAPNFSKIGSTDSEWSTIIPKKIKLNTAGHNLSAHVFFQIFLCYLIERTYRKVGLPILTGSGEKWSREVKLKILYIGIIATLKGVVFEKNLLLQSDVVFDSESNGSNIDSLAPSGDEKKIISIFSHKMRSWPPYQSSFWISETPCGQKYFSSLPGGARETKLLPFDSESKTTSDCCNRFFSKKSPLKGTIIPMYKFYTIKSSIWPHVIIFHPIQSRLAIHPFSRSPLSDDTKKSGKSHVCGQVMPRRVQLYNKIFNFLRVEPNVLEFQNFFRNNFRPLWIRWAYFWKVWSTFFLRSSFWNLPKLGVPIELS